MAAKFSMASGMFGAADHMEASDRMQQAMNELKVRDEEKKRVEALKQEKEEKEMIKQMEKEYETNLCVNEKKYHENPSNNDIDDSDEDDDLLNDPELERLRAIRLKQLKASQSERQENLAKGHGSHREIVQDEFLKEVTSSKYVLVHFYHSDFEKCKVIDKHLQLIAPHHVECKFLKLNAEKAPFFVEKLKIRVLPTIICFDNGIAMNERVIGYEGLTTGLKKGCEDEFKTSMLARRLMKIGVLNEDSKYVEDSDEDDDE